MSLQRVYLETSFVSYVASALQRCYSSDIDTAHREVASALWWTRYQIQFDLFISETVSRKCASGHPDTVRNHLPVLAAAQILPIRREIVELTARLVEPTGPLHRKAEVDATHIAYASVYQCEYLLTRNFECIATAFLQPIIYEIVNSYGYRSSLICTPEEFMGDRDF